MVIRPPRWTIDELNEARLVALAAFVSGFGTEGTEPYRLKVESLQPVLDALFRESRDLRALDEEVFLRGPNLVDAARFLTAPPISAANLKTVVGGSIAKRKTDPVRAAAAATLIGSVLDPVRYPWLGESRNPTKAERRTAILWTASIWAIETMRTGRRNRSAKEQELLVRERLAQAGFQEMPRKPVKLVEELAMGTFTGAVNLGRRNCDVLVRLKDGRLLAIECKVSSEEANSKKRLNNDVGAKAESWRSGFGEMVVTASVLSGVFSLGDLVQAQDDQGITIFWAHELGALVDFVLSAK
jgi:hypothetical protein